MRLASVLVTGASGEIGHGLIDQLARIGRSIVTIDIAPREPGLARRVRREFTGSITDKWILERVMAEFEVDLIFHLAALLSTRSEFTPIAAPEGTVEGTLTPLHVAAAHAAQPSRPAARSSSSARRRSPPTGCRTRKQRCAPARSAKTTTCIRRRCTAAKRCIARSRANTT